MRNVNYYQNNIKAHVFLTRILIFFSTLALFSCNSRNTIDSESINKPIIIETKGYNPIISDILPPTINIAGKPIIKKAPISKWVKIKSNVNITSKPILLNVTEPIPSVIGKNGFANPSIVGAIINSKFCSAPTVVLVKDAYIKDHNPYNFTHYGVLQGLRSNQVRDITRDKSGNLWLGTDDGLTKYDGKYFYHYTKEQGLNNNLILHVFQDRNENIWFGSFRGGVTKFDGICLTTFTSKDGLPNNVVNGIMEDNAGNMWFSTGKGLVCFNGQTFTSYTTEQGLLSNDVRFSMQDKDGLIWIATMGGGLSIFDGINFKNYTTKEGFPDNNVLTIIQDNNGFYWIGTASKGVVKYDGQKFLSYTTDNGLQDNSIRSIIQDKNGYIWIASANNGISKFDGNNFTVYGNNEGLASDFVRVIIEDKDGTLWIGTRLAGLCRFGGNTFRHYTKDEGLSSNRIMSILEDTKDKLWIGTYGGFTTLLDSRIENGDTSQYFSYFGKDQGLQSSRTYSIIEDRTGCLWFGTDGGGITKYDGKYTYTYNKKSGLAGNTIRDLVEDSSGNIWIATYGNGISVFDGQKFTNYSTSSGLTSNNILTLKSDIAGNIWIGTDGGGVSKYHDGTFTHFNSSCNFLSSVIYSIAEEKDGTLWFGSNGEGLIRYDGNKFYFYNTSSGLNNNDVLSILVDSQQNLWAGTRNGINIISKSQLKQIKESLISPIYESYNYDDGFLGIGCNLNAIAQSNDGTVWIGTTNKLTSLNLEFTDTITTPLKLEITDVKLHNTSIPWSLIQDNKDTVLLLDNGKIIDKFDFSKVSKWFGLPQDLILSHRNNSLTFSYDVITFIHNKQVRYKYKLEGLEENWNSFTDRTEVSYNNLKPGTFTFRVKALDTKGIWSKENVFQFTIHPAWYNTIWFYSFLVIFILYLIYFYIKKREIRLRKEKAILEIKVKEKTKELLEKNSELEKTNIEKDKFFSIIAHDLKGPFNGFLGLTNLMVEDINTLSNDDFKNMAVSMRDTAVNLYSLLENLLQWSRLNHLSMSFNPSSFNLKSTIEDKLLPYNVTTENKGITFHYDIPENIQITADLNMLLTILRNLISNAIKFTPRNGKIELIATKNNNGSITIKVSDNGIGMSKEIQNNLFKLNKTANREGTEEEPSTGLGLIICKEFVEKHGGTLSVTSEQGKGSSFYFTLPTQI